MDEELRVMKFRNGRSDLGNLFSFSRSESDELQDSPALVISLGTELRRPETNEPRGQLELTTTGRLTNTVQ